MNRPARTRWFPAAVLAVVALLAAGYMAQGASESDLTSLQSDKAALQQQLASRLAAMLPVKVL